MRTNVIFYVFPKFIVITTSPRFQIVEANSTDWLGPPHVPRGASQPVIEKGSVETERLSFGRVQGWVFGAWGEASEMSICWSRESPIQD